MPTGHIRQLLAFSPGRSDQVPAFRIAVSIAVPLVAMLLLGRPDLTIFASFGAFTAIYGRQEPLRERFRHQCEAGGLLLAMIMLGALLSFTGASAWVVIPVVALAGGVGAVVSSMLGLKPPGAIFYLFAAGAIGSLPPSADLGLGLAVAALSVVWCLLVGLLARLIGEGHRGPVSPVAARFVMPPREIARQGLLYAGAALIAGVLGEASGLSHFYWAMVAAVAPISAPDVAARLYRGIHRVVGTFGGILVAAFVLSTGLQQWHLVVYVVLFQFLAELFVIRNYGFALLFITPLALLMLQLAHPTSTQEILTARMAETAIGAAVGLALVLLFRTTEEREADTRALPILRLIGRRGGKRAG
ncbi:FUSC family protein [Rothia sp. AR01]|uniref:FUSC family protein n=1 Tax=Rothia santali TaxID=2949643 RepID=A0A9X2HHI3_9MICC|nr:FUSC family protein [Rothia santali]MCP3425806.1 FUSC family protein [Rothia santali]